MKIILRTCLVSLFLLSFTIGLKAQVNVDETNLVTRLSALNNLGITEAVKYFTDHGYALLSKQTIPQPTYSMDLYKYRLKDQTSSYILMAISGSVSGAGYITYNEDEHQDALKIIKEAGFIPGEAMTPESGKTLFTKGNLSFLIQQKTTNNKTFYVMMLSDLLKTAQLSGIKK
jgi:hypothetical protein